MSSDTAVPTKRRGVICIGTEVWKELGKPEEHEAWHKALLLPDAYEVERAEDKVTFFQVFVLSEAIPENDDHISHVEVLPYYSVDYHEGQRSQPYLTRIEIKQWDGDHWKLVAITDEKKAGNNG